MMAIVPFRWLGASRLAGIRGALDAQVAAWAQAWSTPASPLQCDVQPMSGEASGHHWYLAQGPHGTASMGVPANAFESLGCRLVGAYAADAQGFAAGLGRQALGEFLCRLVGSSGHELALIDRQAAVLDPRHGSAALLWTLADLRIALHLDAALCAQLAPTESPRGATLVARRDAIGSEQVTLQATLDLGSADLASTTTLRPGDVIRTSVGLDAQLRLCAGDAAVATATLIASAGHRACRVTPTHTN